jgi:hypothetical protein
MKLYALMMAVHNEAPLIGKVIEAVLSQRYDHCYGSHFLNYHVVPMILSAISMQTHRLTELVLSWRNARGASGNGLSLSKTSLG